MLPLHTLSLRSEEGYTFFGRFKYLHHTPQYIMTNLKGFSTLRLFSLFLLGHHNLQVLRGGTQGYLNLLLFLREVICFYLLALRFHSFLRGKWSILFWLLDFLDKWWNVYLHLWQVSYNFLLYIPLRSLVSSLLSNRLCHECAGLTVYENQECKWNLKKALRKRKTMKECLTDRKDLSFLLGGLKLVLVCLLGCQSFISTLIEGTFGIRIWN